MRPIIKLVPGTYTDTDGSTIVISSDYPDYSEAKTGLVYNLGEFCSYCEEAYHQKRDLDVEHIQPKNYEEAGVKIYDHLKTKWSNFLLSCKTCNGTDNKGTKNVILGECHLPHLNNTFKSLIYKAGGVVEVNPELSGLAKIHAENLLNLVRLDKTPETSCPGDTRCRKRKKDWDLAEKYKKKYELGKIDVEYIIDLVTSRGGWSIWYTVFDGFDDVRKALLEFPGTAKNCFDPKNGYRPIDRFPGYPDPT